MHFFKKTATLFGLALLLAPSVSHAIAVGLSPATYELTMREGQSGDLIYTLSRDEVDGPFVFDVTAVQDQDLVQLSADTATIPAGEHTSKYTVTANTAGLEEGVYESLINFQDGNESEEVEDALSIRYGIQGKLIVTVADSEAYLDALQEAGLKVAGFYVQGDRMETGERMNVHYSIENSGTIFVDKLTHKVEIFDVNGDIAEQFTHTDDVNLAPYEHGAFSESFTPREAGEYAARVQVFYEDVMIAEESTSFSVTEKETTVSDGLFTILLIFGVVLAAVGLLVAKMSKR